MNKIILSISFLTLGYAAHAQAPAGYYADTAGLTGYELKTKLHNIIKTGHIDKGYGQLWEGYKTTDRDYYYENNGTLLDLYSEKPAGADAYEYNVMTSTNRCGNYNSEGDCFNREHTIPQSLFNSASPMMNDIQFIIPTDGYVNGKRSNFPYGKVNSPTWTSSNGSKLGPNVATGYSGTVFEPIDEFKGDIARILFYFATRYQDKIPGFTQGDMLDGTTTRSLQQWQVDLLLQWHNQDPVSTREIDRNNAAYTYQKNRNPFVDHPQWVNCIWGNVNCNTTVDTGVDTGGTSVRNITLAQLIEMYPNPAASEIKINSDQSNKILAVNIYAIDGRTVLTTVNNSTQAYDININIQELQAGMYFVNINTEKGIAVKKLMKL